MTSTSQWFTMYIQLFAQEPYLVCEKTDGERHLLLAYQGALHFSESNVFALSIHVRPRVLDRQKVPCLELPSRILSFLRDSLSLLNSSAPRCSFLCRTTMHGARSLLNFYPCWSCCYVTTSIVCRAPGWHHKTLLDGELVVDSEDEEVLQANCFRILFWMLQVSLASIGSDLCFLPMQSRDSVRESRHVSDTWCMMRCTSATRTLCWQ